MKSEKDTKELRERIIKGVKLAVSKLIESTSEKNGYLIISQNGKVVKIKASDLK